MQEIWKALHAVQHAVVQQHGQLPLQLEVQGHHRPLPSRMQSVAFASVPGGSPGVPTSPGKIAPLAVTNGSQPAEGNPGMPKGPGRRMPIEATVPNGPELALPAPVVPGVPKGPGRKPTGPCVAKPAPGVPGMPQAQGMMQIDAAAYNGPHVPSTPPLSSASSPDEGMNLNVGKGVKSGNVGRGGRGGKIGKGGTGGKDVKDGKPVSATPDQPPITWCNTYGASHFFIAPSWRCECKNCLQCVQKYNLQQPDKPEHKIIHDSALKARVCSRKGGATPCQVCLELDYMSEGEWNKYHLAYHCGEVADIQGAIQQLGLTSATYSKLPAMQTSTLQVHHVHSWRCTCCECDAAGTGEALLIRVCSIDPLFNACQMCLLEDWTHGSTPLGPINHPALIARAALQHKEPGSDASQAAKRKAATAYEETRVFKEARLEPGTMTSGKGTTPAKGTSHKRKNPGVEENDGGVAQSKKEKKVSGPIRSSHPYLSLDFPLLPVNCNLGDATYLLLSNFCTHHQLMHGPVTADCLLKHLVTGEMVTRAQILQHWDKRWKWKEDHAEAVQRYMRHKGSSEGLTRMLPPIMLPCLQNLAEFHTKFGLDPPLHLRFIRSYEQCQERITAANAYHHHYGPGNKVAFDRKTKMRAAVFVRHTSVLMAAGASIASYLHMD